jgi:hypothetical protein
VGTLTSAASSPVASVVIVSAETGCIDKAKPLTSDVITKPRRDQLARGNTSYNSGCNVSIGLPPSCVLARR